MTVLAEYESVILELTRTQAEALQRTGYVTVAPAAGGCWRVTASSWVGSLVVEDVSLLIRPKINPENLFLLLEPGLPPNAWRKEAFDYDTSFDLLPAVVAFFARSLESALGRGVLRAYERREQSLVALRGRVDVSAQFRTGGADHPVACVFDEFSENVIENQALRAAIRVCLRTPRIAPPVRQRLMRHLLALEGVADVPVPPQAIDAIAFTRLNRHYSPALGLARIILANHSLLDARGTTSAASFMVNMNDLFQRFVTERLRRHLRGRLEVVAEQPVRLDTDATVLMSPDLFFRDSTGVVRYVGDIKYKISGNAIARSSDYYQLLAYTTALNLPEGVLIYCGSGAEKSTVRVRHVDKQLVVHTIDLSGSPAQVEKELGHLADIIHQAVT